MARRADIPGWPRRMDRALAAAYCGISATMLDKLVEAGIYPKPHRVTATPAEPTRGRVLFDKHELDAALDAEIGLAAELLVEPEPAAAEADGPDVDPFVARIRERGKSRARSSRG